MEIATVAVVYKKTRYRKYMLDEQDAEFRLLAETRPHMFRYLESVYQDNQEALAIVTEALEARGISYRSIYLGDLDSPLDDDLVISVGGDGTLLAASHFVIDRPMIGVNSSPKSSVGFFSCATAANFAAMFERLGSDTLHSHKLSRARIQINDEPHPLPVLNDVLFTHRIPAATARYTIQIGQDRETQRSSGVWISTAAGSTAAIKSAGGMVMPLDSTGLQYRVRELYRPLGEEFQLEHGIIEQPISLSTNSMNSALYIDGHDLHLNLAIGDIVKLDTKAPKLLIYGLNLERRKRFE